MRTSETLCEDQKRESEKSEIGTEKLEMATDKYFQAAIPQFDGQKNFSDSMNFHDSRKEEM